MAKQVSNIFINLGIKNAEGLDKLKSAFRELDKAVGPTSKSIDSAIAAVKRFSDSNERSEQLIRGQIEAFKGLRSQVDVGGKRYSALTNEIGRLQAELRGSTDALERQREKLLRTASAGTQNAKSLQNQIASLERLRQQTRPGSSAFIQLGKDIDAATVSLGKFKSVASQAAQIASQGIGASFAKAGRQVQALQANLQTLNFSSAEFLNRQKEINRILNQQASSVGRQNVRANAAVYTDPGYSEYMERRGRNLPLPATPAGYQQRIGEINAELENITNLKRRRELTLELDKLNRQLKGTIIDATSAEQRAVDVVRARVNAQREVLSQSGFGAFSASVRGRNFKAEQQQQTVANVKAAFAAIETAYESMSIAVQSAEQRTLQQELNAAQLIEEGDQRAHAATMQRKQQEADAGERWFRQELARLDILAQQRKAAASALGLGGRDLSPLYERITGLATAGVSQQQQFMGRNATQVYNDIATAFNKGGRPVDIKEKSTYIGDSIAQGVSEGANASSSITSGAKGFADKLIGAYKTAFGIKSPSRESKQKIGVPIGQGIGEGIIEGVNSLKTQIQLAIKGAVSTPGKAPLPGAMGPLSSTAERLQAFVVQSAANAPSARRYSRLLGGGITSSGTIPLAMYRRAYERGELMPEVFGSLSERRLGRQYAIPGTPGYGLERMLQAEATRAVGRTGAFVGPLSGALTRAGALGPLSAPRIPGALSPVGAAPLPIFAASRSLAPLQGSLPGMAYALGSQPFDFPLSGPLGRSQAPTRSAASASLRESIGTYRKAIDNFWEGETNTFTTVHRIVSGSIQVNASRLARTLTETRTSLNTLTSETTTAAGLPAATFARLRPVITARKAAFQRELAVSAAAAGVSRMGGFPVEGMIGPSSPIGGGPKPPVPPTPIGPSGAGGEFSRLNAELTKFGALNRRSINDLQELKGVLSDVHGGLSPIATDYQKVNTAIEKQSILIDKELATRQLGGGGARRLGGQQLAQIAGASISGGIFGGPEGLIGGIAGGIFRGVGGSFAGAAVGAQLGMVRQQLAGTAEYAAQVGKLQIALRGVAGTQDNYNQAINAAAAATRDLNIPQMEALQGITRLSAAVLGAGGSIGDANFAFRAISESIKATGGNAEQVDGALLALTQVFSKGKVSAEELNQIAERLPGTFTLFAQAAGKSGPELQKALQEGEVGLNDLMKFLELASSKYGSTALNIAKSSQEAGARLQIAYDKMRLDVGKALEPIGAELQTAFADLITNLAPSIVDSNGNIGASFAILTDPVQRIVDLFKELGKTKSDLQPLFEFIDFHIKALTTAFYVNNLVLEATLKKLASSSAQLAALAKGDLAAVQRISRASAQSDAAALNSIPQTLERIWNPAPKLADIRGTGRQVQGSGATGLNFPNPVADGKDKKTKEEKEAARLANDAQRLNESIAQQEIRLADKVFDHKQDLARRRYELEKELLDLETQNRLERMGSVEREAASIFEQQRQRDLQYADKLAQANDEVAKAAQAITSAQRMAAVTGGAGGGRAGLPAGMTGYITGDPSSPYYKADHGGANYHEHAAFADRATAEAAYKILTNAGIKVTEFLGRGQVGGHTPGSAHYSGLAFDVPASQVPPGQEAGLTARVKRLLGIGGTGGGALQRRATADQGDVGMARLDYAQAVERRRLLEEKQPAFAAASQEAAALALSKAFREQNQELEKSIRNETIRAELQRSGYSESYVKLQLDLNDALERRNQLASQVPLDQPGALAEINTAYERRIELLKQTYDLEQNLANSVGFREGAQRYVESIGTLREATAGLAQQGFKGIEDAIVSLATTGTANFAQFATSLLNDMARIIIQQFVVKQLTQAIMGLFGGGGGGGGLGNYGVDLGMGFNQIPSFPMGSALPSFAGFAGMAKGGVFAANGIVPYAMGGIVNRPTLFPFANGGAIGTGLMGEAGPEAIMPLQRGPNGKLGVVAAGGGTTNVVVNVDASGGSTTQGKDDNANQLGKVIAAAVQQELVRQKRPGGLLA